MLGQIVDTGPRWIFQSWKGPLVTYPPPLAGLRRTRQESALGTQVSFRLGMTAPSPDRDVSLLSKRGDFLGSGYLAQL
jgi:hypothetical protein